MINGAHIPGVHNVCALFVLKYREVLPGPLFFHQCVLIAARLGASAPVGIPSGHIIAQKTTAGIADAHSAVTESFNLQILIGLFSNGANFIQVQLPGQYNPLCAQIIPGLGAFVVCDGLLGGDVSFTLRGIFSGQRESAQIRDDQRIYTCILQLLQIGGQLGYLFIAGHGVHGHVSLNAVAVGEFHSLGQLLRGEVSREGTHTKGSACQIYSIRAVQNGHLQPFHISGGA